VYGLFIIKIIDKEIKVQIKEEKEARVERSISRNIRL